MHEKSSISSRIAAAYRPDKVSSRRCPARSATERKGDVRLLINAWLEEISARDLVEMTFRARVFGWYPQARQLVAHAVEASGVVREGFVLNLKGNHAGVYMLWGQIAFRVNPPIRRDLKAGYSSAKWSRNWLQ
jgi:hypothetical protein